MTTAEQFRSSTGAGTARHARREISIAGVPWPAYKVVALLCGLLVLVGVAAITGSVATAVLSAAAVSTVGWIVGGSTDRAIS